MRRTGQLMLTMAVALAVAGGTFLFGLPGFELRAVEAAQTSSGTGWAWGGNSYGQLGDGTTTIRRTTPVQVSNLSGIIAVDGGHQFSLGLKDDGTVWAWGAHGTDPNGLDSTPVQVPNLSGITAIAAGEDFSLALKDDGTVWSWGNNDFGQLGDGTNTYSSTPVQVSNLSGITAITAGGIHSLALRNDGTVWSWGNNNFSQLGDGTTTNRTTPVQVSDLSNIVGVSGGVGHSLALKSDGTVWAWGANDTGQLGDGTRISHSTPVRVSSLSNVTSVSAGWKHNLALKDDGTVWAWGNNDYGELGDGSIMIVRSTPVQVSGPSNVANVSAGSQHSLAVKSDGTVWAWGRNDHGQLGDGTNTSRFTPIQPSGLSNIISVSGGSNHSLAIELGASAPPDTTAPTAQAPEHDFKMNSTFVTGKVTIRESWSGSDDQSGIAGYELQRSVNGNAYKNINLKTATTTARNFRLSPEKRYQFRIRAQDEAGNWSEWQSGDEFSIEVYQEGAPQITYGGPWSEEALTSAYDGGLSHAADRNDTAEITVTGTDFAWIAPRDADRGISQVWVDDTVAKYRSQYFSEPKPRKVMFSQSWDTSGTHTIKMRVLGKKKPASSGTRVDVDAFAVLR